MNTLQRANVIGSIVWFFVLTWSMGFQSCTKHDHEPISPDATIVVATVGGDTIHLDEFKEFSRLQGASGSDLHKLSVRKQMLDQILYKRLLKQFVLREGLLEDPRIRNKWITGTEERIGAIVRQREVYDPFITDSAIAAVYKQMGEEIRARHILISYREAILEKGKWLDKEVARRTRARAKELADSLHAELRKMPGQFESLVTAFSNDENTQYLDGDLGYLRFGKVHPALWDRLWPLGLGEPSAPVETAKGFHILKAVDRRPVQDLKPMEELRDNIRSYLGGRYISGRHPGLFEALRVFEERMLDDFGFQSRGSMIGRFIRKYRSLKDASDIANAFSQSELDSSLAIFRGGRVTVAELVWEMEDNLIKVRLDEPRMLSGLRRVALTRIVAEYGRQRGYQLTSADSATIHGNVIDAAEELAHRQHVELQIKTDDSNLRSFYNGRVSDYTSSALIDYMEIFGADSARVLEVYNKILQTNDFDGVYREASGMPGFKCRRTGPMPADAIDDIARVTGAMKAGDICRPFRRPHGGYAILKLMSRQEGIVSRFEDVRDVVRADYLAYERRRRMLDWMEELRTKYPTHVYEDALTKAFTVSQN